MHFIRVTLNVAQRKKKEAKTKRKEDEITAISYLYLVLTKHRGQIIRNNGDDIKIRI